MIAENIEFKNMINSRLEENMKSFNLLFSMKHYGNCISIMCQELDQIIRLLFLLKSNPNARKQYITSSINNQKWHITDIDNHKDYVTDKLLLDFTKTLSGWDKGIYEFGFSFNSISHNYNYGSKNPINSLSASDRKVLYTYIQEYHVKSFPKDFSLDDIIPILPLIMELITINLKKYLASI
jgi:hypothetical protein